VNHLEALGLGSCVVAAVGIVVGFVHLVVKTGHASALPWVAAFLVVSYLVGRWAQCWTIDRGQE
jgi:hypothetical protein